ncbi:hypothetical protein GCM10007377_08070 [Galliscardovia ingluviei]|uniref:Uncharacterized protein n=1 Tax=Galliscardovia ingluviei TaxID=1769422 RepID=A0A8J3AJA2_9BIFI|nr:hypothetical protein [Galliscardovia ingluviei]GGI13860.1 hypothetical protein GCM10007377_08070 [Galliscardovia ingluviei]
MIPEALQRSDASMVEQHNKIINAAARSILAPEGLFRIGASRTWIDDNGYFVILVEYQPFTISKGSTLNVAVSFLWESSEGLNTTFAFNYGSRVGKVGYVPYTGDDADFSAKMEWFAQIALQKVREYRRFRDLDYAKAQLEAQLETLVAQSGYWNHYDLAMLCFLKRDYQEGLHYFNLFLRKLSECNHRHTPAIDWEVDLYNHCIQVLLPQLESENTAYKMVRDMITRRRTYFSERPSTKKLGIVFD